MKVPIISVVALISFVSETYSGVPLSRHEESKPNDAVQTQQSEETLGLYDANDKVLSITSKTLESLVYKQKYATLLEFYNSFCGHCKRFAPKYKELAEDTWPWRNIAKVMAIDCADDENADTCRDYEVMAYPTLRYFPPGFEKSKDNMGEHIKSQKIEVIKKKIIRRLMNETKVHDSWPDFSSVLDTEKANLFTGVPTEVQYVIAIFDSENSTLAGEMIVQFNRVREIRIRRVTSPDVATAFGLDKYEDIVVIDRNSNIEKLSPAAANSKDFKNELQTFLKSRDIHIDDSDEDKVQLIQPFEEELINKAILQEVKNNEPVIYLADLENALRYTIFHEIPNFREIKEERLLALQRYINAVKRYNPLGEMAQKFLQEASDFIMLHNQEILGEDIKKQLVQLESQYSPIFSSSRWIGCQSSKPKLRGFTCGLWQYFHFMTVAAAQDDKSSDPLEVLRAIHGYVKYFFGCTECSNHFQEMAARRNIWNTVSKNEAVQWLWSAHNEVNQRLAGDETEDPEFPKMQYPARKHCVKCHRDTSITPTENQSNWDENEVLTFLKKIYGPENISRYGIDDESVLPPTMEKLRGKRMVRNMFSDMDMRMGIFLYVFCIGMMVVAVKLFLYKGYRKKIYTHDFLGKV